MVYLSLPASPWPWIIWKQILATLCPSGGVLLRVAAVPFWPCGWHRETWSRSSTAMTVQRQLMLGGWPCCWHLIPSPCHTTPLLYCSGPRESPPVASQSRPFRSGLTPHVRGHPVPCVLPPALPTDQGPRDERRAHRGSGPPCWLPGQPSSTCLGGSPLVTTQAWPTQGREEGRAFRCQLSSVLWHTE